MPKLPRDVAPERLIRFMLRHGWRVTREGARHTLITKNGQHIAIPRHGPLKTGLLASILKQSRLQDDAEDL